MGCPLTVDALPTDRTDPRLQSPHTLVALKSERVMGLYAQGHLQTLNGVPACFPIALAWDPPLGHKKREGDRKTPEGWYDTSDKPWSSYKGAIAVHYPNTEDANAGFGEGAITAQQRDAIRIATEKGSLPPQNTALGGAILIHGGGASADWTLGCIALEDLDLTTLRLALRPRQSAKLLVLP